jgi:hypothetical protein
MKQLQLQLFKNKKIRRNLMYSNNKQIRDVANIAAQIMSGQQPVTEKLHPNQQKLDVHEPEKDKLTAKDFEMLRAKKGVAASRIEQQQKKKMKEEVEQEKPMTFSEMIAAYKEHGLSVIAEEPTEEEFNKEIKKAQAKSVGKEKADVAAAAVQAVKQEETEIQVINADIANGVEMVDIEERQMTEPEMKKKEQIVKSMKKGMKGFKERYGERAKEVMYATATKQAMKD